LLVILTNLKYRLSMALRPEDLPSDPAVLIEIVLSLDAENDRLRTVIGTFKDMVFGSRSEKLSAVVAD
jgi:transposase